MLGSAKQIRLGCLILDETIQKKKNCEIVIYFGDEFANTVKAGRSLLSSLDLANRVAQTKNDPGSHKSKKTA